MGDQRRPDGLDVWLAQENVKRFASLLEYTKDANDRAHLENLLKLEREKLDRLLARR